MCQCWQFCKGKGHIGIDHGLAKILVIHIYSKNNPYSSVNTEFSERTKNITKSSEFFNSSPSYVNLNCGQPHDPIIEFNQMLAFTKANIWGDGHSPRANTCKVFDPQSEVSTVTAHREKMFLGIVLRKNHFQASDSGWAGFFVLRILAT
jgi:hypothetical protein